MKEILRATFELLKSESLGLSLDSSRVENLSETDLRNVLKLCKPHDIQNIIASGLLKTDLVKKYPTLTKELKNELLISLSRYERSNYEFNVLRECFEKNNIHFLPLKGVILRDYYHNPSLRTSSDIDIFLNPNDVDLAIKSLRQQYGYKKEKRGVGEVSIYSQNDVHVELLYVIEGKTTEENAMLEKFNTRFALKDGKSYEHETSLEFFYTYVLAHTARHFKERGAGIRHVLDVYVMNKKFDLDASVKAKLLEENGLTEFEKYAVKLSKVWFDGEEHDEVSEVMEKYILASGVYGGEENYAINDSSSGKKGKYVSSRLWLKKEKLEEYFPNAKIKKSNTIFYQFRRWLNLLSPKKFRRSVKEVMALNASNEKRRKQTDFLMENLELKKLK